MEPLTITIAILGTTIVVGLVAIARQGRNRVSKRRALIKTAKLRAEQKVAAKGFADTEPMPDFDFRPVNKISDDRHLGYGQLSIEEDRIINAIFDDRLAPPMKIERAYTVHGSYADSIFNDANISETIEPKFE